MKQAEATRVLLTKVYPLLVQGRALTIVQDESLATKFGGRRPEDGAIDWNQSAESIHNLVRAVAYPWPGAFSTLRGQKCMIWRTHRYRGPHWLRCGREPSLALRIRAWWLLAVTVALKFCRRRCHPNRGWRAKS
jgi:methionyl-tRNA formyltransferase